MIPCQLLSFAWTWYIDNNNVVVDDDDGDDDDDDYDDKFFSWDDCPVKGIKLFFQPG